MPLPLVRGPGLWEARDTFHGNTGLRRLAAVNLGAQLRFKGDAAMQGGGQDIALRRQMAQPPPEKDQSPAARASALNPPRASLLPAPGLKETLEGTLPVGGI